MLYRLAMAAAIGLVSLATLPGLCGEIPPSPTRISFRCVKTPTGPMIEVKANSVVFLVPYLKVPSGGWPREGEMHPVGEQVAWTSAGGINTRAECISVDPIAAIEDRTWSQSLVTLRCVATKSGPMIQIRTRKLIVLVPSLKIPAGKWPREGELQPLGENLGWKDENIMVVAREILIDPEKSSYSLNGR